MRHEASGWLGGVPAAELGTRWSKRKKPQKTLQAADHGFRPRQRSVPARLADVTATTAGRLSSGIGEFDRVLGGGFVRGSLVLIGGDPGIGKSTLLLQVFGHMSTSKKILYVTGEESPQQVKIRADRLGLGDSRRGHLLAATGFSVIERCFTARQTRLGHYRFHSDVVCRSSTPPRAASVRSGGHCWSFASGERAEHHHRSGLSCHQGRCHCGPSALEHMVDTVLYFESTKHLQPALAARRENRFGATDELGVFEMSQQGLIEVENASLALLRVGPFSARLGGHRLHGGHPCFVGGNPGTVG